MSLESVSYLYCFLLVVIKLIVYIDLLFFRFLWGVMDDGKELGCVYSIISDRFQLTVVFTGHGPVPE